MNQSFTENVVCELCGNHGECEMLDTENGTVMRPRNGFAVLFEEHDVNFICPVCVAKQLDV